MSNGLIFEIRYIILGNFQGCKVLNRKGPVLGTSTSEKVILMGFFRVFFQDLCEFVRAETLQ